MISTAWSTLARERSVLYLSPSTLLQGTTYKEDGRQDFFKAEINNRSLYKVYSDKRIILVVKVNVKRKWGYGFLSLIVAKGSNKKEYQFSYADLPRLSLNDVEDMYMLKV
ncbi:hypothetical protein Tco_0378312 [Tanacetum coccineum]